MTRQRPSLASALLSVCLMALVLTYPFLVYRYLGQVNPAWFAAVIFCLFLIRFMVINKDRSLSDWLMLGIVSTFCLSVTLLESQTLLKFYPVMMNVGVGLTFLVSLTEEQCLIDKMARMGGKAPPPEAYHYLRTLTLLWGLLLLTNGAVSAYTACYTSLSVWTLYNGFLSYLLIAGFAGAEWVYRGFYKKKHNIIDDE